MHQAAAERKARLKRFGEATKEQAGDSVTVRQAEDIPFERIQKTRQTTEEKRAEKEDLKSALAGSDKSAVVGRSVASSWSAANYNDPTVAGSWPLPAPWRHGQAAQGHLRCMHKTGPPYGMHGLRCCTASCLHMPAFSRRGWIGCCLILIVQPAGHAVPAEDGAAARAGAGPDPGPGAAARRRCELPHHHSSRLPPPHMLCPTCVLHQRGCIAQNPDARTVQVHRCSTPMTAFS